MEIFYLAILLFIFELLYIYIAKRLNITDQPNFRSSHNYVALRGGGIIYPIAFILLIVSNHIYGRSAIDEHIHYFGWGLLLISGVGFIDDIIKIQPLIRLVFHFICSFFILYYVNVIQLIPNWLIPFYVFVIVAMLNTFNFMDGVNGMSGLYHLVFLLSMFYINKEIFRFTEEHMILYPLVASIVFLIFNFRKKALVFLGDIGSLAIAFWSISLLGMLIVKTDNYVWLLLLVVYGIEVFFTLLERMLNKENVLLPHRKHLYELLANEFGFDHRAISFIYVIIQLLINIFAIKYHHLGIVFILMTSIPFAIFYIIIKKRLKIKLIKKNIK